MTDISSSSTDAPMETVVPFSNTLAIRGSSSDRGDASNRMKRPFSSNAVQAPSPSIKQENETKTASDDLDIMSFRNAKYESVEMQRLLSLNAPEVKIPTTLDDVTYKPALVFPDWVLHNQNWKLASLANATSTSISDILKTHFSKRTPEQVSTAVHWLMSVWKIADTMGFKRCNAMLKEFKLESYTPGTNIITEGERGLTFYIIIEGKTAVHKDGIGMVGYLGKGKSFGEIALTQGKDLRTATITAQTAVDVVSLHKTNYEYFVRDIQDSEKRENFKILSECKLFNTWPKGKIEKMLNSCVRKTFEAGQYIFHQGDPPHDLCIMVEGNVEIVKELVIVCKNRWPVAINRWKELKKRIHKPILLKTLHASDFFGEMAILKDMPRSTSAIAVTRTVVLSLDRLEFLHLISYGSSNINGNAIQDEENRFNEIINKYINDQDILDAVSYFKGGPDSEAVVGTTRVLKNELHATKEADEILAGKDARVSSPVRRQRRPQSHNEKRAEQRNIDETYKYSEEISRITKGQELIQQLQKTAKDTVKNEQLRQERAEALVGHSYAAKPGALIKQTSRFGMARNDSTIGTLTKRRGQSATSKHHLSSGPSEISSGSHSHSTLSSTLNDRRIRGLSAGFHRGSIYNVDHRRSSTIRFSQRGSIAGIDDDPSALFGIDSKVLLRKNTAITLGPVYQEVYRQLQNELSNDEVAAITMKPFVSDRKQSLQVMDVLSRQMIDTQLIHRGSICGGRLSPLNVGGGGDDHHHHHASPDRGHRTKQIKAKHISENNKHEEEMNHSNDTNNDHHALHFNNTQNDHHIVSQKKVNQPIHGSHGVAPLPIGVSAGAMTTSPYQGRKTYLNHNKSKGFNTGGTTKLKPYYAYEADAEAAAADDTSVQSMGSTSVSSSSKHHYSLPGGIKSTPSGDANDVTLMKLHDFKKIKTSQQDHHGTQRKGLKYLNKANISYRDAMEG